MGTTLAIIEVCAKFIPWAQDCLETQPIGEKLWSEAIIIIRSLPGRQEQEEKTEFAKKGRYS